MNVSQEMQDQEKKMQKEQKRYAEEAEVKRGNAVC
jgi:hypothetical protein